MSAVETSSPLIQSWGRCNDRDVINYTLWHMLKQQPCWSIHSGVSVTMGLSLTCKKLEVCGFHFSSGLPCHVFRMLKHTWLTHTHKHRKKVSNKLQQNEIHPRMTTFKSNTVVTQVTDPSIGHSGLNLFGSFIFRCGQYDQLS